MSHLVVGCKDTGAKPDGTVAGSVIKRLVQQRSTVQTSAALNVKGLIENHRDLATIHVANVERHDATVVRFQAWPENTHVVDAMQFFQQLRRSGMNL